MTDTVLQAAAPLTVYFDGACPICRREIAVYRSQAGAERLAWVDVAADEYASRAAAVHGPVLDREAALARLHVRRADGQLLSGAAAFNAMWLALPRWRWLGRLTAPSPVLWLLEAAYRVFLKLRPLWRRASVPGTCTDDICAVPDAPDAPSTPLALDAHTLADLRSDHAGETGAVWIYKGILAVSRDVELRRFAVDHLNTEQRHLVLIDAWLPAAQRSHLLPVWRLAGFVTGAMPALLGPSAVYRTIEAVERFVDRHYQEQIDRLDGLLGADERPAIAVVQPLRDVLERCRQDECHHRDDASQRLSAPPGWIAQLWAELVGRGSAAAVQVCRRL